MVENGFYILDEKYIELISKLGGKYNDNKSRPIFCCMKDKFIEGLYWMIPTSDLSHRTPQQIQKYRDFNKCKDIRSAYYYIGTTSKPALFKISNALPVSDKYIAKDYIVRGTQLIMKNEHQICEIQSKLKRILAYESKNPNKFEQHITALKEHICKELSKEQKQTLQSNSSEAIEQTRLANEKCDRILAANPELRAKLNAAAFEYYTQNKLPLPNSDTSPEERYKMRNAILNENPALKAEYIKAKNAFERAPARNQQQSKPKPKHRR